MLSQFRLQHLAARVHMALELTTPHPHQRLSGPLPLASLAARVNRPPGQQGTSHSAKYKGRALGLGALGSEGLVLGCQESTDQIG